MSQEKRDKLRPRRRPVYLPENPHREMPHQKQIIEDIDPFVILNKAAEVLKCDVENFHQSPLISASDKNNRDLLIYFIWETGVCTNQKIGDIFGLIYSSVSRRASIVKSMMEEDNALREKFNWIK